jgi:hypothetical protein
MDFLYIITEVSKLSSFLPVIVGFMYFSKINKPFKRLVYFLCISAFNEYLATEFKKVYGTNVPLLHLFTPIEFSIFFIVFGQYFRLNFFKNLIIITAFWGLAFLDAFYINNLYTHNTVARPTESIILMIASFYYFYLNLSNQNNTAIIYKEAMFWYATGILIYFSINFYMFLMVSQLVPPIALFSIDIHSIVNIIANLLFAKAFTCFKWKN